jgi:exodeoxyribonuclease VII large subunit
LIRQNVEVIILARGGGSLEDLWAFNDEALARAIVACPIPIITGIGHETDFTIADFVADVRAPTPSAAAELATPDKIELKRLVYSQQLALSESAQQEVAAARANLQRWQWALERVSPQAALNNYRQRLDILVSNASRTLQHTLSLRQEQVKTLTARLATLNPQATLARGYAIVQKGSIVVTQTGQVNPGDNITVKVSDGEFEAEVGETSQRKASP